jgi:hypothetical protein
MTPNNRFAALALATFLAVPAAHAAIAVAASFDDKVDNAAAIILGRCIRTESKMDPSGKWIVTYSTFAVEKSFKGGAAGEVTIVTPGGKVGSLNQSTVGVPDFREGDEHVLFVKNTKAGPTVLYFDQGTYDVRTDAHGERVIAQAPTNLVVMDTQRGMAVTPSDEPRTVRQFETAVRESLRTALDRKQKMAATPAVEPRPSTFADSFGKNKLLIALALAGLALAGWQLFKRR